MNLIDVDGTRLEVLRLTPSSLNLALSPLVFLHEGLG
jgi:hypothetical protein